MPIFEMADVNCRLRHHRPSWRTGIFSAVVFCVKTTYALSALITAPSVPNLEYESSKTLQASVDYKRVSPPFSSDSDNSTASKTATLITARRSGNLISNSDNLPETVTIANRSNSTYNTLANTTIANGGFNGTIFPGISASWLTSSLNNILFGSSVGAVFNNPAASQGCLSFIGGILQAMWANCKERAQTQTWQTWTGQLQNALTGGNLDAEYAARETCRLQAEQQSCEKFGQQLVSCDLFGMLQTTVESGQAKQRCDSITTIALAPQTIQAGVQGLVSNEIVGGILRNFLGKRK